MQRTPNNSFQFVTHGLESMAPKKIILLFICVFGLTNATGQENIQETNLKSDEESKTQFGCTPPDKWDLFRPNLKEKTIRNVCLSKGYQVNEPPENNNLTPVLVLMADPRILEVDAKRQTLALDIKVATIWEDSRIYFKISDKNDSIKLPPIANKHPPIWYPFISIEIKNLKVLRYLYDPIIVNQLKLVSGKHVNRIAKENLLLSHEKRIFALVKWTVKLSCRFDFSRYPFDTNTCPFRMRAERLNVTNRIEKSFRSTQTQAEGFDLEKTSVSGYLSDDSLYGKTTHFGIDIKMRRLLGPFVYQYYLPCFVIVIASFLSFIISFTSIPARVSLVVTLFLTLSNMFVHQMVSITMIRPYFIPSAFLYVYINHIWLKRI